MTAAEKTRVGRAERPGLGRYIGICTTAVDFVHRPLTGSKGRLGFRRRVKITTEKTERDDDAFYLFLQKQKIVLYRPRVQGFKVGKVQMSARVCVVREATVPQGASCVCESARVGGSNCGACV